MDSAQSSPQVVVREAEADAHVAVETEVIPGHDEHALVVTNPFRQSRLIDVEVVAHEGDGGRLGWPDTLYHGLLVLLAIGFFVALVIAWDHGEKGHQRTTWMEGSLLVGLLASVGVGTPELVEDPQWEGFLAHSGYPGPTR